MAYQTSLRMLTAYGLLFLASSADVEGKVSSATCLEDTNSGSPASLLQKVFHLEAGTMPVDQDATQPTLAASTNGCKGVEAQDRCWHLSDLGESCIDTCNKFGEVFSFVVPDTGKDVTPLLAGFEPRIHDQPWGALECFESSDSRYHSADPKAALHFVGNIGAWTNKKCSLACPCSGRHLASNDTKNDQCAWKQPAACAAEFEWKGSMYHGCATVDHATPWCLHHHHHTDQDEMSEHDWSPCVHDCGPDRIHAVEEACEWKLDSGCLNEFDYEGTHYVGCTGIDHDTPWCSLSDPYAGAWAHCQFSCPANKELEEKMMKEVLADDVLCSWQHHPQCTDSFVYKDINYTGCTDMDHPTPWCSFDSIHKGEWGVCERVCAKVAAATTNTTEAALPGIDPCVRTDDTQEELDRLVVGNNASLDEDGYKVLTERGSLINTRRFICRVIEKISCRVIDGVALKRFVPYFRATASHQSYDYLEHELTINCHAGGRWLVPA